MREGEVIFFAPGYTIKKMHEETLLNKEQLIDAFKKRVYAYYLDPAKNLPPFAQGVLCCSLIDFLAKIRINNVEQVKEYREFRKIEFNMESYRKPNKIHMGERIISFLVGELKIFSLDEAYSFCEYVRNGLIHEGRIKCGCYLDNTIGKLTEEKEGVLIFNTRIVLGKLELWFNMYVERIGKGETYDEFYKFVKKIIDEDLKAITLRSQGKKFPCRPDYDN